MTYPYIGPEVARLIRYKSFVEQDRNKYQRRAHISRAIAIGSAVILPTSLFLDFQLASHLLENGPIDFGPDDPRGLGILALAVTPMVSFYSGVGASIAWGVNAHIAHGKKKTIDQISNDIKQVEKGVLQ